MIDLMAAAFVFLAHEDPQDDSKTYEARYGSSKVGISVYCGAATGGEMELHIRTGEAVKRHLFGTAIVLLRFDQDESSRQLPEHGRKAVWFKPSKARWIINRLERSERLRMRFNSSYQGERDIDFPLNVSKEAISKVRNSCNQSI